MRNKDLIIKKLEKIDSKVRVLNYHLGVNNRDESYASLDQIRTTMSEIKTLLNTEIQD